MDQSQLIMKNKENKRQKSKLTIKGCFTLLLKFVLILFIISGILFGIPRLITQITAINKIEDDVSNLTKTRVGIVFGAGLTPSGSVTLVLRDRVDAAAQLYFAGKVEKLLMSGDNRFEDYNEPGAMYDYAVSIGIPAEDIVLDYAGRRTYDTCYRASEIFGIQEAILITQNFHLPRAIFLCQNMGIDAVGYKADLSYYRKYSRLVWNTRETPATMVAVVEAWITHPLPVLGDPEPISFD